MSDFSWGIDTPGLDEEQARVLVAELLRVSNVPSYASAVDPNEFLTLRVPANVVRVLRQALKCALDATPEADEDAAVVANLDELLGDWQNFREKS